MALWSDPSITVQQRRAIYDPAYRLHLQKRWRKAVKTLRDEEREEAQMWLDIYQPGTKADLRKHRKRI